MNRSNPVYLKLGCSLLALHAVACGDDLPDAAGPRCVPPSASEIGEISGIYRLLHFTSNAATCTEEGSSVLEPQRPLLFVSRVAASTNEILTGTCADSATCRQAASSGAAEEPAALESARYTCSIGDGSLYGKSSAPGTLSEGQCAGASLSEAFMARSEDGTLSIEARTRLGAYSAPPGGGCTSAATEQRSESLPCARFQVIRAEYVEGL